MIELSMAAVLAGFGAMFYFSHRREMQLSHVQWVISATRLMRDNLELSGRKPEAEIAADLADELSSGCGAIVHKMAFEPSRKQIIANAAMKASGDDHLNRIGVVPGALNYLPTKNALYWLGSKMSFK